LETFTRLQLAVAALERQAGLWGPMETIPFLVHLLLRAAVVAALIAQPFKMVLAEDRAAAVVHHHRLHSMPERQVQEHLDKGTLAELLSQQAEVGLVAAAALVQSVQMELLMLVATGAPELLHQLPDRL
jgi:hypothetical protein